MCKEKYIYILTRDAYGLKLIHVKWLLSKDMALFYSGRGPWSLSNPIAGGVANELPGTITTGYKPAYSYAAAAYLST